MFQRHDSASALNPSTNSTFSGTISHSRIQNSEVIPIRTHNLSSQAAVVLHLGPVVGLLRRMRRQHEATSFRDIVGILSQRVEIFKENSFRTFRTLQIRDIYVVATGQCLEVTFHKIGSLSYTASANTNTRYASCYGTITLYINSV